MDKNYLKAIVFSLLILLFYPVLLKWFYPNQAQTARVDAPAPVTDSPIQGEAPPSADENSYLKQAVKPVTVPFENQHYRIEFSTIGGTVTRLFYKGEQGRESLTQTEFFSAPVGEAGIFGVNMAGEVADLTHTPFKLNRRGRAGREVFEFTYELPAQYEVTKTFTPNPDKPALDLSVRIRNLAGEERRFPLTIMYGMNHEKDFQKNYGFFDAVAYNGKIKTANIGKLKKKGFAAPDNLLWAGMIKKYFALLVKPEWKIETGKARADEQVMRGEIGMASLVIPAGGEDTRHFLIYAGPQRYETLRGFGCDFEKVFSRGFLGNFKTILLAILKFFYGFTHNFGWALVLLTLLIKLVFAPLTHVSYANMKKMQIIQPKMKAIQEHYKNDPQKQQRELMELYRRNKVNPVMGCLPMLIQIPIFIAMFRLLPEAIELHGAPFVGWITDLSAPDRLITFRASLPLLGWNSLNILPILMALSQLWYQKIMPQQPGASPEQANIMNFMPLFFGFICYNMPSGLTLYWTLQNLFSIIQQVFINRIAIVLHHEDQ
ncbi:MAG: Membrane protein insertase YidC [Candidatus Omnitrophica bacterium ADurb.Bin277]|mgnify:FL=1|nr:MAG: Membrane protein insertase YidC [Candidatus Omnitrophica bacterium ADurb.Bin277]HPW76579.1 membrane protein insertase YidC [Candidatus Omnitrophota bacterium]HQB11695.1 membrane protein insertase YidC [Candidatus Omnitrophota bacterium]